VRTTMPRRFRKLGTGAQRRIECEHAPSGSGPAVHFPPAPLGREQNQRSPFLSGWHSDVVLHRPFASGP
jgi:hypothetical protein